MATIEKLPTDLLEELKEHPERDPLGFELFLITEDFASIFASLSGGYANLILKEENAKNPDQELIAKYEKRLSEISIIKYYYQLTGLKKMKAAVELYNKELTEVRNKILTQ